VVFAVWQADAAGIYSDESVGNTTGQTFVHGYPITDSNGAVPFKSIVPGRYSGRTIHVHVMIRTLRSSGSVLTECTTQLFLDQTPINALTTSVSPYSSRGLPDTSRCRGQHLFRLDAVDACQSHHRRRLCCVHNYRGTNNLAVLPEPVHAFEI
jgi:hypothetical protein